MVINGTKSNIVYFRTPSIPRTRAIFTVGECNLEVADSYKYLGLLLNEYLDFSVTAKAIAKSASRALGWVIAKAKSFGRLPYRVFHSYMKVLCAQ